MKAIVRHKYGPPDVLRLEEVENPVPADNDVLIQVRAASVNPYDWHFMRGDPYPLRLMAGPLRPRFAGLGADVAGEVAAIGKSVTRFKPHDAVFGTCQGSFAEYASAGERRLAMKPASLTFEQAASIPIAGITALQALRDEGRIQPGHKVLINGAAGGVGTFAVQIAKSLGGMVTGVCSSRNAEMVRSLGAEQVIDYTREDFTKSTERYDILLDLVGNRSLLACRRVLGQEGIYVGAGGKTDPWMIGPLIGMLVGVVLSASGRRKFASMLAKGNSEDLTTLGELITAGRVTPVIDRRYTLNDVADAVRYLEEGHARGKVVINIAP
ncbi:MAG TPA: NAD(P)-dependent alcohol dehydrogenase [Verrucomicrobiae bacterium]|nr:NAD(P)-dependent alcohol dehydrogenase [Verrucomicrobiae bacterium]